MGEKSAEERKFDRKSDNEEQILVSVWWASNYYSLHLTVFTSKVLDSYILDGDLL